MPGAIDPLDRSILIDVRPFCNVDENDNGFDNKLIPLINGQFMMAHEFGIGYDGFRITGSQQTWRDWLGDNGDKLSAVVMWLGLSVAQIFNPSDSATVSKSIQNQIDKQEYLLRGKSEREGMVKDYVPSAASYYDHIHQSMLDDEY